MSGALPFVAIGLLLAILLILSLLRAREAGHALPESLEEESPRDAPPREPFPQELGARLFGSQDYGFIARQGSPRLTRLFLKQRTALALSLLRGVRTHATRLIRVHIAAARANSRLKPLVEVRVVAGYLFIQVLCQVLALLIWLRGPVDLFRLVGYADELSKQLYELTTRVFPAGLATASEGNKP